jgi:hypothetical protein
MDIDKAVERLLDHDKYISYSQRVAIVDIIESLKCCENCCNSKTMSQVVDIQEILSTCENCIDKSNWQPIK